MDLDKIRVAKSDFNILGELKSLQHLNAIDCGITGIDWITGMESLETAGFDGNNIEDFSPVKKTKKLEMVADNQGIIFKTPFDDLQY